MGRLLMRMEYDRVADAAMVYLKDGPIRSDRQEVVDLEFADAAIVLDLDQLGRILAIEFLGASKILPDEITEQTRDNEDYPGGENMTTLEDAAALARGEQGLAVVSTLRSDGTIQSSLVNAGVLAHPVTNEPVLAFVTYGKVKLANLRARPQVTTTFRNGWQWATVEGQALLAGPADPQPWLDSEKLRLLLRAVFVAAGGSHDDWAEYDRVMTEQGRTVVLIEPTRVYSN
jgi:PPOX class probable F420-dependent enzyme